MMNHFSYELSKEQIELECLYDKVDEIDEEILELQSKRMDLMQQTFTVINYINQKEGLYV